MFLYIYDKFSKISGNIYVLRGATSRNTSQFTLVQLAKGNNTFYFKYIRAGVIIN